MSEISVYRGANRGGGQPYERPIMGGSVFDMVDARKWGEAVEKFWASRQKKCGKGW